MKHRVPHIIALTGLLCCCIALFSQTVMVRATANRDKILVGEPIELKLEANVPADAKVNWFLPDSIPHFEYIDKGKIDTITSAGTITYRQTVNLTSFDSGRWHIAALPLEIGNKNYLTDSLPVSVAFSDFDPSKDYHDIKDILETEAAQLAFINWILAGVALISLLVIIYFLRKKPAVVPVETAQKPVSNLSPLQEALEALQALKSNTPSDPVQAKLFHTKLNNVFRHFVFRKTGNPTMEKTSGDLMIRVKESGLANDSFTRLAQAMRMSDAVKFAKYLPATEENLASLAAIKESIEKLDKKIS